MILILMLIYQIYQLIIQQDNNENKTDIKEIKLDINENKLDLMETIIDVKNNKIKICSLYNFFHTLFTNILWNISCRTR